MAADAPSVGGLVSRALNAPFSRHFLFFAALFVALLTASCSLSEAESGSAGRDASPDAVFIGFSRDEIENGIVTFTAKAERAEYFQDKGLLVIYKVVFEDRGSGGGSAKSTGEADKAVYHEDTGDAEFSGYVRLYSKEEDTAFETSELRYFSATQTIEGAPDNPVIVKVGQKLFLHGTGFFADIQAKSFAFRNGVQGSLTTESTSTTAKGEGL
ncbi:MAG: LPS export ABC transporter periplasmic protein LptC [Spirochaetales bacterium]